MHSLETLRHKKKTMGQFDYHGCVDYTDPFQKGTSYHWGQSTCSTFDESVSKEPEELDQIKIFKTISSQPKR